MIELHLSQAGEPKVPNAGEPKVRHLMLASAQPRGHVSPGADLAYARDRALLAAVAFGRDRDAFEELYRLHVNAVRQAAARGCRNRLSTEAVTERTFTTLWERAGRLAAKPVQVRQWLLTVARNACVDSPLR